MSPIGLFRALGLASPLGLGIGAAASMPDIYNLTKDDPAAAASRSAHGKALRNALRDSFNADRERQGLPPLWVGEPTPVAVQPPSVPVYRSPAADLGLRSGVAGMEATSVPPLPPATTIPSLPIPPASLAMQPEADNSYAQAPAQDVTGPSLIQKFLNMLHAAGPGVMPDRHGNNGW